MQSKSKFKHGDKRTWEMALEAVEALGGSARGSEIIAWLSDKYPTYNRGNRADLDSLCVNSPSRTSFAVNKASRLTNSGHSHDRLFKVGHKATARFEFYDPDVHGVWEIFQDINAGNRYGMGIRRANMSLLEQLGVGAESLDSFSPENIQDARKRILREIYQRQGQAKFRASLVSAYNNTCAVTGCKLLPILEAAHIHPYKGKSTNFVTNGLLVRADIHTLFDLNLIAIDSETMKILISPKLSESEYAVFAGKSLAIPINKSERPNAEALDWHRSACDF